MMAYIYDILLNFLDYPYEFFEWNDNDDIKYIKKVPLFKVKTDILIDILENDIIIDKSFLERILYYAGSKVTNIRLVCMIILNNLLTAQEIQKSIIEIEGILPLLEKIAFEDNSNMEDVVMKEGNESTNEDSVEAKQLAMGMIGIIKNVKKEK